MPYFKSDEIEIFYERFGEGEPVVLVHGFASNGRVNWVSPGWVKTLNEAGFEAIVMDNRGHGRSQKLYSTSYYPAQNMAADVLNLIDELDLGACHLLGYSMGSRIGTFAAIQAPEKVKSLVIGGMGINLINGVGNSLPIVDALLADSDEDVYDPVGKVFRQFAKGTNSDLRALAACMGSSRSPIKATQIEKLDLPVLVVVGSEDDIAGSMDELVELLPNGRGVLIEGRDHMRATGDKFFKTNVVSFFNDIDN